MMKKKHESHATTLASTILFCSPPNAFKFEVSSSLSSSSIPSSDSEETKKKHKHCRKKSTTSSVHRDTCPTGAESSCSETTYIKNRSCHSCSCESKRLTPIGVFWDIENCQISHGCSATNVAHMIRDKYFEGHQEVEFMCVCDINKENPIIIQELNDAQVTVVHVAATCKNAADDKLRQALRRFGDTYSPPATIILISGDVNFASDLSDLRHRKNFRVILLHNQQTPDALLVCANQHDNFHTLLEAIPKRSVKKQGPQTAGLQLFISNLPFNCDVISLTNLLRKLSSNCGGKVVKLKGTSAIVKFASRSAATRARKRMDNEDVYGHKISVNFISRATRNGIHNKNGGRDWQSKSCTDEERGTADGTHQSASQPGQRTFIKSENTLSWKNGDKAAAPISSKVESTNFIREACQPPEVKDIPKPVWKPSWKQENNDSAIVCEEENNISVDTSTSKSSKPFTARHPHRGSWNGQQRGVFVPITSGAEDFASTVEVPTYSTSGTINLTTDPVELQVSNLDQSIDARELKRILLMVFREHVMVLHVSVFLQTDGNLGASIKVPSQQDAQYAISQLHRRRIGSKRILISYLQHSGPSIEVLRTQVSSLLLEVPQRQLPLFKFRELFEKRFHTSISVADLYKMRDLVLISEDTTGRMISLCSEYRQGLASAQNDITQEGPSIDSPYCPIHCPTPGEGKGWAEREVDPSLPAVFISLKTLALRVHSLLHTHNGLMPLASLPMCYSCEFGGLEICEEGVLLEHLVSCIPGVEILTGSMGFRQLQWQQKKDEQEDSSRSSISPPLVGQLNLFSRELVDLLKTVPHCLINFNKFIPAYHHHFGRQCRVADYGFTKLIDLFDALRHVVQVVGEGTKRLVTLSHRTQVKRFTSDLLRVLKAQPSKQIALSELPIVYEKLVDKPFSIVDYGVCELADMLSEVSENTVVVSHLDGDVLVAIPKREQTSEEIEKTKQFAAEMTDCEDRNIHLSDREQLRVLAEQVSTLVKQFHRQAISLDQLPSAFCNHFGFALNPKHFHANSWEELLGKIRYAVKMVETRNGPLVIPVDRGYVRRLGQQVRRILMEQPSGQMVLEDFCQLFENRFNQQCNVDLIRLDLEGAVQIEGDGCETTIKLTPLQLFARNIHALLQESSGRLPLSAFESSFLERFGEPCRPAQFGFPSVVALLEALSDVVLLRGRGRRRVLLLNRDFANSPIVIPVRETSPGVDGNSHSISSSSSKEEDLSQDLVYDPDPNKLEHMMHSGPAESMLYGRGAFAASCAPHISSPAPMLWGGLWGSQIPQHGSPPPFASVFPSAVPRFMVPHMPFSWSSTLPLNDSPTLPPAPSMTPPYFPTSYTPPMFSDTSLASAMIPPHPNELPQPQHIFQRKDGEDTFMHHGTPVRTGKPRIAAHFSSPIQ